MQLRFSESNSNMTTREELDKLLPSLRKLWASKITAPSSVVQEKDRRDKSAKGPIWISRCSVPPPPEEDLQQLIFKVINHLAPEKGSVLHDSPSPVAVSAEWLGARKGVDKAAPEPEMNEAAKFESLSDEVGPNAPVVLFLHGGNMTYVCLMDARDDGIADHGRQNGRSRHISTNAPATCKTWRCALLHAGISPLPETHLSFRASRQPGSVPLSHSTPSWRSSPGYRCLQHPGSGRELWLCPHVRIN
jgi:hypothetical protein